MASQTIKVDQTVDNLSEVGKTVVVQACTQVASLQGQRAALECAAGALSAAVGVILVTMGEEAARRIVASAVDVGVQYMADEARRGAH